MKGARKPLGIRGFRRLTLAYTVNGLGNWVGQIALAILVLRATHSPLAVAGVWIAGTCAPALIVPALVTRLEAFPRQRLLPFLYVIEASLFLVLALGAASLGLALVLATAAADGLIALTARALVKASVVAVTRPRGLLREGNAVLNLCFTVNAAAGPALAGVLVAGLGVQGALLADAGSFIAAGLALGPGSRLPRPRVESEPLVARFCAGLDYVRSTVTLQRLILADAASAIFFATIVPVEIIYITDTLHSNEAGYGVVVAAWGCGMMLGGALLTRLSRVRLPILLLGSSALMIAAYLAMGLAGSVTTVAIWSAIGGIGNGVEGFALMTAFQERTADAFQARVNGLVESVGAASPGIGFVLGGAFAAAVSPRATYILAAAGALAVVAAAAAGLRHAEWSLPDAEPTGSKSPEPSPQSVKPSLPVAASSCG